MKTGLKIISGAGSLFVAAPSGYGIYHVWDVNNPTGDKWLLSSGYTFNKPTPVKQENLGYSCSENLFSEQKKNVDQNKLYGCAVMKMEKTEDDKFIKFNSEIALRKGNDGWIINTLLENHNRVRFNSKNKDLYKFKFGYVFTKKELGATKNSESWFFWDNGTSNSISQIYVKVPKKNEDPWYNANSLVRDTNDDDAGHNQTEISFTSSKEWSGVWISDNSTGDPWIFENLEVWGNNKDYSEIFCKEVSDSKCSGYSASGSSVAYKTENPHSKTWFDNSTSGDSKTGSGGTQTTPSSTNIRSKITSMITSIKDIQGNWMDLNEVCNWRWNRNLDDSHLDKLKMYCSK